MRKTAIILIGMVLFSYAAAGKAEEQSEGTSIAPQLRENTSGEVYIPTVIAEGTWGDGKGELGYMQTDYGIPIAPRAITVKDDILYVLDSLNVRIMKFTTGGEYIGTIDLEKVKKLKVRGKVQILRKNAPRHEIAPNVFIGNENDELEVDNKQNLYIKVFEDLDIPRILIYNRRGKFLTEWNAEKTGTGIYEFFSDEKGEIFILQTYKRDDKGKLLRLKKEQKRCFKISPSGKLKRVAFQKLNKRFKQLYKREDKPKIPKDCKLDNVTKELIEVHGKKPWLGRTIKLSSGEIYQIVYDDENVDLGWKIIKWEKQK